MQCSVECCNGACVNPDQKAQACKANCQGRKNSITQAYNVWQLKELSNKNYNTLRTIGGQAVDSCQKTVCKKDLCTCQELNDAKTWDALKKCAQSKYNARKSTVTNDCEKECSKDENTAQCRNNCSPCMVEGMRDGINLYRLRDFKKSCFQCSASQRGDWAKLGATRFDACATKTCPGGKCDSTNYAQYKSELDKCLALESETINENLLTACQKTCKDVLTPNCTVYCKKCGEAAYGQSQIDSSNKASSRRPAFTCDSSFRNEYKAYSTAAVGDCEKPSCGGSTCSGSEFNKNLVQIKACLLGKERAASIRADSRCNASCSLKNKNCLVDCKVCASAGWQDAVEGEYKTKGSSTSFQCNTILKNAYTNMATAAFLACEKHSCDRQPCNVNNWKKVQEPVLSCYDQKNSDNIKRAEGDCKVTCQNAEDPDCHGKCKTCSVKAFDSGKSDSVGLVQDRKSMYSCGGDLLTAQQAGGRQQMLNCEATVCGPKLCDETRFEERKSDWEKCLNEDELHRSRQVSCAKTCQDGKFNADCAKACDVCEYYGFNLGRSAERDAIRARTVVYGVPMETVTAPPNSTSTTAGATGNTSTTAGATTTVSRKEDTVTEVVKKHSAFTGKIPPLGGTAPPPALLSAISLATTSNDYNYVLVSCFTGWGTASVKLINEYTTTTPDMQTCRDMFPSTSIYAVQKLRTAVTEYNRMQNSLTE